MGHFSRECKERKSGDEVRYGSYLLESGTSKVTPSKALVNVDSHIDWTVHEPPKEEASTSEQVNLLAYSPSEDKKEQVSLMGISQVHNYVFGCSVRYNDLKQEFDELKPKYNECYVEVEAYKKALKTLERQKV